MQFIFAYFQRLQVKICKIAQMQYTRLPENSSNHSRPIEDEVQLMTANLLKIKRQITERQEQQTEYSPSKTNNNYKQLELIKQQIRHNYDNYLNENSLPTNHQQKLIYLLEDELCMGSTVALFQMLYYFRQAINQNVIGEIMERASSLLINEANNSPAFKHCLVQLLAMCGIYDENTVNYVIECMLEQKLDFQLCFAYLSNVGFPGLAALIHLARQDFKQIPIKILDYLSRTDEIIKQLLIPILMQDLNSAKIKQKDIILVILNRLNSFLSKNQELYSTLIEMMQTNSHDRGIIASVLRASGTQGENILLQFLNQTRQNEKIIFPIVTVLPWRAPSDPVLRIKVIQYSLGSNFLPGTLYQYEGKIEPSAFSFQEQQCCDSLCLNARDFIAALQRLLAAKMSEFQNQQNMRKSGLNNHSLFCLYELICGNQKQQIQISGQVIKALRKMLNSSNAEIREATINSLGLIGLPQAFETIQDVSKCLWDVDPKNRSMACWAISKICEQPSKRVISKLIQLLKDNFWKVRTSACICIGKVVKKPYQNVVQALVRCLKDSSINKTTVCESIIQLGPVGQQILLQILKTASPNDFKLKQAVIYCLRDADVKSSSIDFVLQELFKHCKGTRVQTRAICLETLNSLRIRALQQEQEIIYLKAKSILPFYYYFLQDQSSKIRETAMQSIYSFGNQAELIFIEGITKGSSLVRIESAKGLAKLGIQNFRALILGLRDEDVAVKKVSSDVILKSFKPQDIATYYSSKPNQMASLLCNLKDMLMSGKYRKDIKTFIKQTIYKMQKMQKMQKQQPQTQLLGDQNRMYNGQSIYEGGQY